jgi:hypothetical protein
MIVWQQPSFTELTMNAEIGGYQPEYGDDERQHQPLAECPLAECPAAPTAALAVANDPGDP